MEHWLEREIAQWVHPMKDRSDNPSHHEQMLLPRSYISLHIYKMHAYIFIIILFFAYSIVLHPLLPDWYNKAMLSCLWDDAYKKSPYC